jgi:hypothetical protein
MMSLGVAPRPADKNCRGARERIWLPLLGSERGGVVVVICADLAWDLPGWHAECALPEPAGAGASASQRMYTGVGRISGACRGR